MKSYLASVLVFLALLIAAPAFATTYYVSTTGSDSADGSSAHPWATLQKAANTMIPGDTTLVANGTYTGFRMTEARTGTSVGPITMRAQNAGQVTLNAVSSAAKHNGVLELEGGWDTSDLDMSYWVIDGFVVDGGNAHRAIDTRITSHVTIQNCTARNSKASSTSVATGIFTAFCDSTLIQNNTAYSNTEHGCYTNNSADNGIVRNNVWYSNAGLGHHMNGDISCGGAGTIPGDGIMSGWIIEKNTSYNNVNGYDADGVASSTWRNNISYGNSSKSLQMTMADGATNPDHDRIINNTFTNPAGSFYVLNFAPNLGGAGGTNNVIENNILYHADIVNNLHGSLDYVTSWMGTLTSDYNIFGGHLGLDDNGTMYALSAWQSTFSKDTHSQACTDATTLFVNYAGNNFHLKAGSAAIDHGTTLADVTTDKDGIARPQGSAYDVGCYESVQSTYYQFATSDAETSTTSTDYVSKVSVTLNATVQDDWIIFGFCEFKCPNISYATFVQLFIDATGEGQNTRKPVDPTDYLPFITVKVKNLSVGSHSIQLKYRASNAAAAAYIRNARICAVRKGSLEFWNAAYDNAKALTISLQDIVSLNWTPATTGSYLVISTAELNATTTVSTDLQTLYNGVVNDEGIMRAADNGDYTTFMSFNYCANAPAGVPITHKISGRKMATDPSNHYIRRARILAIRLTGGRFAQTVGGYGTEQNTTQTTFQQALSTTWTYGVNGNWLFLNSARLNNSSTSYQTEVRVQLNNTSTCGDQLMKPKDVSDLLNYSSIDVRSLTTSRTVDMDWRTTNSAGTAKVKRLRFYGLPLDAQ